MSVTATATSATGNSSSGTLRVFFSSRVLKTHFRRSSIPFRTPLDSVVFAVSTPRGGLFQQPASARTACWAFAVAIRLNRRAGQAVGTSRKGG
jgi:hypothetical protein